TGRKQQVLVPLQRAHDVERILAGLLQRIAFAHRPAVRVQFDRRFLCRLDCLQAPVLHLEHEQSVRGMDDDEVRMPVARAYREIVPNHRVLIEEVLEALCESHFATGVEAREAKAGDQNCHVMAERLTASLGLNETSSRLGSMLTDMPPLQFLHSPAVSESRTELTCKLRHETVA